MRNSLAVAVHLISFAVGLADVQDAAYWKAKVSTAIAVQGPQRKAEPAKSVTVKRPIVRVYWATWCGPCKPAKVDWDKYTKTHTVPFDVEFVDLSAGGQPDWAERMPDGQEFMIPAFAWEVKGQTRYIIGYPGAEKLIARWKLTQ